MAEYIGVCDVSVEVEGLRLAKGWWDTTLLLKLVQDLSFLEYDLGNELLLGRVEIRLDFVEQSEALNEKDNRDSG